MQSDLPSLSVLIIDDSPTIRHFIERALRGFGRPIDIVPVEDGEQALQQLRQRRFDITFLDLNMPMFGGVEVMAAIKVMGNKTFAVAMSSNLNEQSQNLLKSFGAYDFLKKPFTDAAVRGVVEAFDIIRTPFDVLVVDDSAVVRRVVSKVIEKSIFNLTPVQVGDGSEAIAAAAKTPFRIVFTDFNMPTMNGVELAGRLAQLSPNSDIILMSSELNDTIKSSGRQVGATAFLKKPFYPEDVDTILHHVFRLRHSTFGKSVQLFAAA